MLDICHITLRLYIMKHLLFTGTRRECDRHVYPPSPESALYIQWGGTPQTMETIRQQPLVIVCVAAPTFKENKLNASNELLISSVQGFFLSIEIYFVFPLKMYVLQIIIIIMFFQQDFLILFTFYFVTDTFETKYADLHSWLFWSFWQENAQFQRNVF